MAHGGGRQSWKSDKLCFITLCRVFLTMTVPEAKSADDLPIPTRTKAQGRAAEGPLPALASSIVRLHLLGTMQATSYLGASVLPNGKKARALLSVLCLSPGGRISRSRLASLLWDRVAENQARTSLRQALHEITRAMGPLAHELLKIDRDSVCLNTNLCWIDALAVLDPKMQAGDLLRSDLAALCNGDLLEEQIGTSAAFDQWLLAERTRFGERLRHLFEAELQSSLDANGPDRKSTRLNSSHLG